MPGLQCIRSTGRQQEVAMPPDGIQICSVTQCPLHVMKPSILFKYGASHGGGCIPFMEKLLHPGQGIVDFGTRSRVITSDVKVPKGGLAMQRFENLFGDG